MKKTILLPLLLWCLAFFLYLGWTPSFAYNAQRYFEWLLIGSLLILGAAQPVRLVFGRYFMLLYLLLVGGAAWVVLAAPHTWLAGRYLLTYLTLFLAALAVAKIRFNTGRDSFDKAALLGVICLCFGASLIVLEGLLLSLSTGLVSEPIIFGAFVNVRFLAGLQLATAFLLPAAWLVGKTRRLQIWITITAMLWWGWLLFSGTRAALVVVPWAVLVLVIVAGRSSWPWLKQLSKQFSAGLVAFLLLRLVLAWQGFSIIHGSMALTRSGASGRFGIWSTAWQHFLDRPWWGNGPGSFACFTDQLVAKPHNIFFLLLSEWGLVVTLLVSAIALWAFGLMIKKMRADLKDSPVALSLFASVVAIVTAGQLQGILISPLSQMAVVLVFGWAWSEFGWHNFAVSLSPGKKALTGLRLLSWSVVIALLAGWLVMAKADLALQRQLLTRPDGTINLSYGPRYWADGHDHCPAWHERYYGQ